MRRIALALGCLGLFCGFVSPELPEDSRAIYSFDGYAGPALKTLSGGLFALEVGFRQDAKTGSRRDRAQALVDRLEGALGGYGAGQVEISVKRLSVETREAILTVQVRDADALERVRGELTRILKTLPETAFVGPAGKASIIE